MPEEYALAWSIYLACCGIIFLLGWRWTRWIRPVHLKHMFRFAVLAAMILPIPHSANVEIWVPAMVVGSLGWVMEGEQVAMTALVKLSYAAGLGALFGIIPGIIDHSLRRRAAAKSIANKSAANAGQAEAV